MTGVNSKPPRGARRRKRARAGSVAALAGLLLAVGLAGCASKAAVRSEAVTPGAAPRAPGILYALPMALLPLSVEVGVVEGTRRIAGLRVAIPDRPLTLVPDPSARYSLHYRPDAFSDDRLCVLRSEAGLLQAVRFAAADRSGDVAVRLAEAGMAFMQPLPVAGFAPGAGEEAARAAPIVWLPLVEIEVPLDARGAEVADSAVRGALIRRFGGAAVEAFAGGGTLLGFEAGFGGGSQGAAPASADGVFFRTMTVRDVTIFPRGGAAFTATLLAPDTSPEGTAFVDVGRAALVRKDTSIRLTDGMLTHYDVTKPSEALSAATLPLDILQAVLDVPARFFTTIASGFRSEAAALRAEADLLRARADLAAQKAQDGTGAATDGFGGSGGGGGGSGGALASQRSGPRALDAGLVCAGGDDRPTAY